MLEAPLVSLPCSFAPQQAGVQGARGQPQRGQGRGPRPGPPSSTAADLLLQRSTAGREGRERGVLEPAGGGWELEEAGMGMWDWEAGPAAHRIVRDTAQAPSPTLQPSPAPRAPCSARGAGGQGRTRGLAAEGRWEPCQSPGTGTGAKGIPREQLPLCQGKDMGQGALGRGSPALPAQERGAKIRAKSRQSWSRDKGCEALPLAGSCGSLRPLAGMLRRDAPRWLHSPPAAPNQKALAKGPAPGDAEQPGPDPVPGSAPPPASRQLRDPRATSTPTDVGPSANTASLFGPGGHLPAVISQPR